MPSKRALSLLLLAAGILVGGAFLSAPITHAMYDLGWWDDVPPQRVFLKVFRRFLLLLVVPLFLWLRPWRDGSLADYGLRGPRMRHGPPRVAFVVAVCVAAAGVGFHLWTGWLRIEDGIDPGKATGRFLKALGAGAIVGVLEEWFFRGWVWRRFAGPGVVSSRQALRPALWTALIFGAVHAFKPGNLHAEVSLDAAGAFEALGGWLAHMADPMAFGPALLGLALFSLLLSGAYLRTGTLWTAVAIHAAAVAVINGHGGVTERTTAETWTQTKHIYDSPLGWGLLGLAAFVCWPRGRSSVPSAPDSTGS